MRALRWLRHPGESRDPLIPTKTPFRVGPETGPRWNTVAFSSCVSSRPLARYLRSDILVPRPQRPNHLYGSMEE